MKLDLSDYIEIGAIIALKQIAEKPMTGGMIAKPLMIQRLAKLPKEKSDFIIKTLGIK